MCQNNKKPLKSYSLLIQIYFWFIRFFVCRLVHEPDGFITEDEYIIRTKRCKHCLYPLGLGYWKGVRNIPPPNSSEEYKKLWIEYCDKKEESVRNLKNG